MLTKKNVFILFAAIFVLCLCVVEKPAYAKNFNQFNWNKEKLNRRLSRFKASKLNVSKMLPAVSFDRKGSNKHKLKTNNLKSSKLFSNIFGNGKKAQGYKLKTAKFTPSKFLSAYLKSGLGSRNIRIKTSGFKPNKLLGLNKNNK